MLPYPPGRIPLSSQSVLPQIPACIVHARIACNFQFITINQLVSQCWKPLSCLYPFIPLYILRTRCTT